MAVHKEDEEQALAEVLKTVRAIVRLKHSLAADRELNNVLPRAEAHFNAIVQKTKRIPLPADIKRAVGL